MVTFLIFFREAFEAAVLCSILLACLTVNGQHYRHKDVYTGIAAGTVASIVAGLAAYMTIRNFEGSAVHLHIEGISYLLACGMLTYMAFGIKNGSDPANELHSKVESVVEKRSGFAIGGFVFLTVFREGVEIVVFMIPLTLITNPVLNVVQGILGIVIGVVCGSMVYVLGRSVPLKHFFNISSILLVLFAAGFLAGGIGEYQQLGLIPFGDQIIWDTTSIMSNESAVGHLIHALFGYTDKPTCLQVIGYILYLSAVGILTAYRKRS